MQSLDPTTCRLDTLIGALLYLMTLYRRRGCRNLARSIAAHLECLAHHPDAVETVRQVAGGMCDEWKRASAPPLPEVAASRRVH